MDVDSLLGCVVVLPRPSFWRGRGGGRTQRGNQIEELQQKYGDRRSDGPGRRQQIARMSFDGWCLLNISGEASECAKIERRHKKDQKGGQG